MPQLGDALRRQVYRVTVEGALSPRQLGVIAGTAAKRRHQQLIDDGALPEASIRYVDGVQNAPETSVRIAVGHPGIIEYKGSSLVQAALYAYQICLEASRNIPQRSSQFPAGTFARSWRLFADGLETPPERIPSNATQVIVVNVAPYARRLEQSVGVRQQRAAYMITEIGARATKSKFSGLSVRRQFVTVPSVSGVPFPVPYHLKGRGRRGGRAVTGEMVYPAVVVATRGD